MGRGRGKGQKKQATIAAHEGTASGEEEKIPPYKRRGRPQKTVRDKTEEEKSKKIEEENGENDVKTVTSNKGVENQAAVENGHKRKKWFSQVKGNADSVKEENGVGTKTSTNDSVTSVGGFRQNGSRRKNKPRRAAEVGVECK